MNLFNLLVTPFCRNKRPAENVNFENDDMSDALDIQRRGVIYPNCKKIFPESYSPNTSKKPYRNSIVTVDTHNTIPTITPNNRIDIIEAKPMEKIEEIEKEDISDVSHDSNKHNEMVVKIHPSVLLRHAFSDTELDKYDFYCKNINKSLHKTVMDISKSCPEFCTLSDKSWTPPKIHGLDNCEKIIPNYYFTSGITNPNIESYFQDEIDMEYYRNYIPPGILQIDYLFIILDDIRNMRKLNKYQIDYIKNSLSEEEKNQVIQELINSVDFAIDSINMYKSLPTSRVSSKQYMENMATL